MKGRRRRRLLRELVLVGNQLREYVASDIAWSEGHPLWKVVERWDELIEEL